MTGTTSLGFVYPTGTDPMCGTGVPAKTALQQLAESIQSWITASNIDGLFGEAATDLSRTVVSTINNTELIGTNGGLLTAPSLYTSVDVNVGTPTDLSVWPKGVLLGDGNWFVFAGGIWDKKAAFTVTAPSVGFITPQQQIGPDANVANPEPLGGGFQTAEIVRSVNGQPVVGQWSAQGNFTGGGPTIIYAYVAAIWMGDL